MSQDRVGIAVRALVVALALAAVLALPGQAAARTQLTAADGKAEDRFGTSVAIDGDTAVVGAPTARGGRGAVYVYRRAGNEWSQVAKLTASNAMPDEGSSQGSHLGSSVDIQGDTIVAGAPGTDVGGNENAGAVYTFATAGATTRTQTAMLTASDRQTYDDLGSRVAIDGDTIVASAPCGAVQGNPCQGLLYTFARSGAANRTETGRLFASDGGSYENLGLSLAIDGDTIVAGAPNKDAGVVYTFARVGAFERVETARLTAPDTQEFDRLGDSAAIDGDTIVAGAAGENAVYTFARSGPAERTPTAKLTTSDGGELGSSVAIDGDTIVAGGIGQGAVYTFASTGANRTQTGRLTAARGAPIGAPVDIAGETIIAGAPTDEIGTKERQGSAWIFAVGEDTDEGPGPQPPRPDTRDPKLSNLRLRPARFTVTRGSRIRYSLSERARVRFRIERAVRGRGYVRLRGSFVRKGRAGRNSLHFAGRLRGRRLAPGLYRLVAVARDDADNASSAKRAFFRIVRRPRNRTPRFTG